jgi:hypothetical protein
MHQRFWTVITKAGFTVIALFVFLTGVNNTGQTLAQTQSETEQSKPTTEPVFRVPKVANQQAKSVQSELVDPQALQPSEQGAPNAQRTADTRNLPRITPKLPVAPPAVLPTSTTPPPMAPASAVVEPKAAPHPLDRAVVIAETALKDMQADVNDYTAILAKRERINGVVGAPSYMNIKVRCPRKHANGSASPFSIYMKFIRPKDQAGREVIWIDGQNDNKLIVHEGSGILSLKKFYLDPNGRMAMNGQRYPIYDAGLENLIVKLIEKADRDRAAGPCEVTYREGAQINDRPCSLIELVHEERRAPYEFHKAQVFIDDELNLPVRFVAYDWPQGPGAAPQLLEEYTYYNVKVNVGLTDLDFNPKNPRYKFPGR